MKHNCLKNLASDHPQIRSDLKIRFLLKDISQGKFSKSETKKILEFICKKLEYKLHFFRHLEPPQYNSKVLEV